MYDVIIIGSGPAGLTAAIYAARFGLSTVVVAGRTWGGQLQLTTDVENFPGFGKIMGPELMGKMRKHVEGLGVKIIDKAATKLETSAKPFRVTAEDETLEGKAVIVATGADTKWLGVPNEGKLRGRGVSSCAPCDAFFFKGKPVAVVGGGDSAMEETHVIANVASDVVLIHRRDEFRAQKAMIDKVLGLPNVRVLYNTQVVDVVGDTALTGVLLDTAAISPKQGVATFDELVAKFGGVKKSGTQWELPRQGVFVAIGLVPNTQIFTGLDVDSHGYVRRYEEKDENGVLKYFTKTNIPGIFTGGDIHDSRYKQAITAAGFGCMAALDVQKWLSEQA
ncbi:MAG: Thioredoxin reductase [Candidatus Gottesmanbacteria bacterium GW2011_GWA2_47_9]|nr:MAG: Thioredoxin reductase [Candidatus Gottesmanbacteria bacterium GW2011_GWA2_47_9]KKU95678.1 MAG: Thioredoxin reductase [Candidatus Gottesmanbacteria bacterium GW2011_GWA1_48_13]